MCKYTDAYSARARESLFEKSVYKAVIQLSRGNS